MRDRLLVAENACMTEQGRAQLALFSLLPSTRPSCARGAFEGAVNRGQVGHQPLRRRAVHPRARRMTIEGMVVMMRMYLSGTLFLLGLVAGVVVPRWVGAFPLETDAPREVPVFRRVLPLGADEPIVLSTNYGNVEVIRTDRDDLELVVRRRRHDDLYLEIEKHGGALHIRSVFGVEPPPGPASLWTFGYELHLPRGTRYEITTGEGRVVGG